jgi:hypothetical protein
MLTCLVPRTSVCCNHIGRRHVFDPSRHRHIVITGICLCCPNKISSTHKLHSGKQSASLINPCSEASRGPSCSWRYRQCVIHLAIVHRRSDAISHLTVVSLTMNGSTSESRIENMAKLSRISRSSNAIDIHPQPSVKTPQTLYVTDNGKPPALYVRAYVFI